MNLNINFKKEVFANVKLINGWNFEFPPLQGSTTL